MKREIDALRTIEAWVNDPHRALAGHTKVDAAIDILWEYVTGDRGDNELQVG